MQLLREMVGGCSVALVGNASSIFERQDGALIDSHDVVIRMNAGYPHLAGRRESTGSRTDIWATAKPFLGPPKDSQIIVWMKLTQLGATHLRIMQSRGYRQPILEWPQEMEDECRNFVGADPGTGIRVLWFLKTLATPRSVAVFGMDCWRTPTHWSGKMNTPNHKPDLEAIAMEKLLR